MFTSRQIQSIVKISSFWLFLEEILHLIWQQILTGYDFCQSKDMFKWFLFQKTVIYPSFWKYILDHNCWSSSFGFFSTTGHTVLQLQIFSSKSVTTPPPTFVCFITMISLKIFSKNLPLEWLKICFCPSFYPMSSQAVPERWISTKKFVYILVKRKKFKT